MSSVTAGSHLGDDSPVSSRRVCVRQLELPHHGITLSVLQHPDENPTRREPTAVKKIPRRLSRDAFSQYVRFLAVDGRLGDDERGAEPKIPPTCQSALYLDDGLYGYLGSYGDALDGFHDPENSLV